MISSMAFGPELHEMKKLPVNNDEDGKVFYKKCIVQKDELKEKL